VSYLNRNDPLRIRRMHRGDLHDALAIERQTFARPWSQAMFLSEVEKPSSICLVATYGNRIVGYLIASRYPDAYHLMTIAVDGEYRRRGIGALMIEALLEAIGKGSSLTLEVRPSNSGAIAMYEKFGMTIAGRRHGYYSDNGEDALIMWRFGEDDETGEGQ